MTLPDRPLITCRACGALTDQPDRHAHWHDELVELLATIKTTAEHQHRHIPEPRYGPTWSR